MILRRTQGRSKLLMIMPTLLLVVALRPACDATLANEASGDECIRGRKEKASLFSLFNTPLSILHS